MDRADDFAENVKGRISTRQLGMFVRVVSPLVGLVVLGVTLYIVLPLQHWRFGLWAAGVALEDSTFVEACQ
jgi:ABC-type transport system involved in cytochrome bd biosynthesis fused ATPase/permease subunit